MGLTILTLVVGAGLMLLTAWQARQVALNPAAWTGFLWLWGLLLGGFVLTTALETATILALPQSNPSLAASLGLDDAAASRAVLALVLTLVGAVGLWLLVSSHGLRARLARLFPARRMETDFPPGTPWEAQVRGFDPDSAIHAYALGLILLYLWHNVVSYVLAGGQAGLVPDDLSEGMVLLDSALSFAMLLSVALVGVGLGTNRSQAEILRRIGLRWPTAGEALAAIGIVGGMLAFVFVAGMVQAMLTPPDVLQEQSQLSEAIAGSVNSLAVGFLIAVFTGVGEEVAFRGGMQPVFGLWPTALLFAATHIQYQFTVASLIIFGVALALGYARQHYGTAAAILAHFGYNFTLLALSVALSQLPFPGTP